MKLKKPAHLKEGDTVGIVSLSWGGASVYPHRYQAGVEQLKSCFKLNAVAAPNALRSAEYIYNNPMARADDLMWCFQNDDINAIICSIGGDDSIRLLKYINLDIISKNPKIFMGYSDATIFHFMMLKAGISSIYGPTIMAGFAENGGLFDYTIQSIRKTLFRCNEIGIIAPNTDMWTDQHLDWSDSKLLSQRRPMKPCSEPKYIQGDQKVSGHLLGGCLESLEMMKGTSIWPEDHTWNGAILFLETSEEGPDVKYFERCMRNYAARGILQRLNGIILGRPANSTQYKNISSYDESLLRVVRDEYGLNKLTMVSQMDFGHTDPMFLIPYGVQAEVDPTEKTFSIKESAVI